MADLQKVKKSSLGSLFVLIPLLFILVLFGRQSAIAQTPLSIGTDDYYLLGPSVTYLEDTGKTLTINDIVRPEIQARFSPLARKYQSMNFGMTRSALWFRITLCAQPDAAARWLLETDYPPVDYIDLYMPLPKGGFERKISGDLVAFNDRSFRHRNHVFPVELSPGAPLTLYLRAESEGTLAVPLKLWRPEALAQNDQKSYSLLSLYYGLLIGLLLYNLLLYISLRDRLYLIYVAFVASMALGQLGLTGFGAQFLWPQWAWWTNLTNPLSMGACSFFAAIFTRGFLSTASKLPRIDKIMILIAALAVLIIFASLFLSYRLAAWMANTTIIMAVIFASVAAVYSLRHGHYGARYFLLAWTALLLSVIVLALRNMGVLPSNTLTANAVLIGSALEMLLLSFALADRINLARQEKEAAQTYALATEQSMVESLRQSERLLEIRVSERTAALEEANAQLKESQQLLKMQAYHDPLTGLANRLLFIDRLSLAIERAKRSNSVFALLMIDLNDFKIINDSYGHSAGDTLLVAVAERLKAAVRTSDTVARLGGDEFVLILESLADINDIATITDKLVAAVNNPVVLKSGELVRIGISMGLALYPQHGPDAERLINYADKAMYESKKTGVSPVLAPV
jgi:diguanylate cyclase (GGDEF)-like protein